MGRSWIAVTMIGNCRVGNGNSCRCPRDSWSPTRAFRVGFATLSPPYESTGLTTPCGARAHSVERGSESGL
jgi:hypothetical protein